MKLNKQTSDDLHENVLKANGLDEISSEHAFKVLGGVGRFSDKLHQVAQQWDDLSSLTHTCLVGALVICISAFGINLHRRNNTHECVNPNKLSNLTSDDLLTVKPSHLKAFIAPKPYKKDGKFFVKIGGREYEKKPLYLVWNDDQIVGASSEKIFKAGSYIYDPSALLEVETKMLYRQPLAFDKKENENGFEASEKIYPYKWLQNKTIDQINKEAAEWAALNQ